MIKKHQRGVIALLTTSLLLVATLIISVASYKNVSLQAKRVQNQVESRQDHWLAEGGLECAYTKIQTSGISSNSLSSCNKNGVNITTRVSSSNPSIVILSSKDNNNTVIKKAVTAVAATTPPNKGANYASIKSTSPLSFRGSVEIRGGTAPKQGCTVLQYSKTYRAVGSIETNQSACAAGSQTHITSGNGSNVTGSGIVGGVQKVPKLTPFEDIFNTPRSKWWDVMHRKDFARISNKSLPLTKPGKLPPKEKIQDCAKQIVDQIKQSKNKIWLYGDCALKGDPKDVDKGDIANIRKAIAANPKVKSIVLVSQGKISITGTDASGGWIPQKALPALLYSFDTKNSGSGRAYYQKGSLKLAGGMVFDAPNKDAFMNGALEIAFNKDVIDEARFGGAAVPSGGGGAVPSGGVSKNEWVKGSWHDF